MPEKPSAPAFDKCRACALAAQNGPVNGSLPTSHGEVCCLYKFHRQGQPPLCLKEKLCDGLCENCLSRVKFQQQLQATPRLELPSLSKSDTEEVRAPDPARKGSLKIAPRRRRGFKKLTIELRPPKFKKKLWFGTYEPEDVDRAKDAINFFLGSNLPYNLSDSPSIFAQYKLGIEYRELHPSCEQFVQVGEKKMRAIALFARRVKEVIHTVTGKRRAHQRPQRSNGKKDAKKVPAPEPVVSCASDLTSLPCVSDCASAMACEETSNLAAAAAATTTAYGASSSEVNSELATAVSLPSCENFTFPYGSQEVESFNLDMETFLPDCDWWIALDGSSPAVEDEPGIMEDNGSFPSILW